MHRSKLADELLNQIQQETQASILFISEQYKNKHKKGWFADTTNTAAIWVTNPKIMNIKSQGKGEGYVWIQTHNATYYISCYFTPNEPIDTFQNKLNSLEDDMRMFQGRIILAGDFNAKALEWGMPTTDSRGRRILEMTARLALNVINTGNTTTFRRPGYSETIPDVTFASEAITPDIKNWRVREFYTGSDHQYITWNTGTSDEIPKKSHATRWNTAKLNVENLVFAIQNSRDVLNNSNGTAEDLTKKTVKLIRQACDVSMPRIKCNGSQKKSKYWWNNEINDTRKECLRLRRKLTRANRINDQDSTQLALKYKTLRRKLKIEIRSSKRSKWEALTMEVNNDPWGLGYKIVTDKILSKTAGPVLDEVKMRKIVDTLFPNHPSLKNVPRQNEEPNLDIVLFSKEELMLASSYLQNKKAPGPDSIPTEVLKAIAKTTPEILLNLLNTCLNERYFPKEWKIQRLVLIPKGKGDPNSPSAYRPLCMLNTMGKLYEKLLQARLMTAVEDAGGLSNKQHGFRKGFSTIGAIKEVVQAAHNTQHGNRFSRNFLMLVTLDVKNAFNSASWKHILDALEHIFKIPVYLMAILRSYLSDRRLIFDTLTGTKEREITAGAAQGSILGPDLWNIFYNSVLEIEMPGETSLVGYADDVAALVRARNTDDAQRKLNQVMRRILTWMEEHDLSLATEKTEIVIITPSRMPTDIDLLVGSQVIRVQKTVKYLGVQIDQKLNFWEQIKNASDKASKTTTQLSRLMANVRGPSSSKRKLIMAVTHSILLYGSEIWADSLQQKKYRKRMAAAQRRGALRIASAYRTVSEPAVLVIAGVIPIDLLAEERKNVYDKKGHLGKKKAAEEARDLTVRKWQRAWEEETRGRWTAKLIPTIEPWLNRKHGEVTFYITQFLSGHGCFRAYLHKMKLKESPACGYCDAENDDAEHTFFICPRWANQRKEAGNINIENVMEKMIANEDIWQKFTIFAEIVLKIKQEDDR